MERNTESDSVTAGDSKLREIYYNPGDSGSLGGCDRLLKRARELKLPVTRNNVLNFLAKQQTYTLHKPTRKKFNRNKTYAAGIDKQWQADLADMQSLSKVNDGFNYLLTVIDVFSKFAWVIPLRSKTSRAVVEAFEALLKTSKPRKPVKLQTDKGKEFFNQSLRIFFTNNNVHHFSSNSDAKAAVVERFNRTLKTRIWAYFTAKKTTRYLDVLQQIVDSYNHSFHRSIGMTPAAMKSKHEGEVYKRLYPEASIIGTPSEKLGNNQTVRLVKWKSHFDKGYIPIWTKEHFTVKQALARPIPVYKIADTKGEGIQGVYYRQELQPISANEYTVERIVRQRKTKTQHPEVLVKWSGWSDKFNTWIPIADLNKYHGFP